jgi:hypothetical protein
MQNASLEVNLSRRRQFLRLGALALLCASLAVPLVASAQMREFTGVVERAGGKKLVVGNRMGDSVTFSRIASTKVTGIKSSWGELAKGDRVTVSWTKKRAAHRVRVLRAKKEK